jgi:hypothetical protein
MVELNNMTAALTKAFQTAVENNATNAVDVFLGLVAAIIIFIIGWIVAVIISRIFGGLLKAVRLEDFLKEHKVEDSLGSVKISNVLVKILKYYIILIFLQAAVTLIELGTISTFLNEVLKYAPVLVGSALVALVAVILGEYIKEVILDLSSKSGTVRFAARAVKLVIVYIGVTMALSTAGFNTELLNGIFLLLFGAIVFGMSLAIGSAFGLGAQKDATDMVGWWRKHLKI